VTGFKLAPGHGGAPEPGHGGAPEPGHGRRGSFEALEGVVGAYGALSADHD
jgi:hypothetical protein